MTDETPHCLAPIILLSLEQVLIYPSNYYCHWDLQFFTVLLIQITEWFEALRIVSGIQLLKWSLLFNWDMHAYMCLEDIFWMFISERDGAFSVLCRLLTLVWPRSSTKTTQPCVYAGDGDFRVRSRVDLPSRDVTDDKNSCNRDIITFPFCYMFIFIQIHLFTWRSGPQTFPSCSSISCFQLNLLWMC